MQTFACRRIVASCQRSLEYALVLYLLGTKKKVGAPRIALIGDDSPQLFINNQEGFKTATSIMLRGLTNIV